MVFLIKNKSVYILFINPLNLLKIDRFLYTYILVIFLILINYFNYIYYYKKLTREKVNLCHTN